MKLLINIGNTNLTIGIGEGNEITWWTKCRKQDLETFYKTIDDLRTVYTLEGCYIASVVPSVEKALFDALKERYQFEVIEIVHKHIPLDYSNYGVSLGIDRLLNAYAATEIYSQPSIIFDLGTATSVQVVDHDVFLGGMIMPGIKMGLEALNLKTDLLPQIETFNPTTIIANTTEANLISGAIYGVVASIEGVFTKMQEVLNTKANLVLTGGNAKVIKSYMSLPFILDEQLLLKGILIASNNYK